MVCFFIIYFYILLKVLYILQKKKMNLHIIVRLRCMKTEFRAIIREETTVWCVTHMFPRIGYYRAVTSK